MAKLSLEAFDALGEAGLHDLGRYEREVLWAACMLHDIGVAIDYDDHHRHSHYLILNSGLPGWSPRELELIALVARWHRKGAPDASRLGALERKGDGKRLKLLCGVIRLSEQLERSPRPLGGLGQPGAGQVRGAAGGRHQRLGRRAERGRVGGPARLGPTGRGDRRGRRGAAGR